MSKAYGWFVHDPVDGASFYATEQEAHDAAEKLLDEERDRAVDDEWVLENVESICYGRVCGEVVQTKCTTAEEGSGVDEIWDFELRVIGDQ
jgi:hypothetical protein